MLQSQSKEAYSQLEEGRTELAALQQRTTDGEEQAGALQQQIVQLQQIRDTVSGGVRK